MLNYSIEGALSEEFFEFFKSYTLPLQSYPYFRELTHSLTTRTGLSGLILPLRRVLKKESKEVEGQKKESKKSKKEAQSAKASN